MKKIYDVIIIGAGPAGLFAAYELIEHNKKLNILLLDEGKFAENRFCPMSKNNGKCLNCKPCNILSGYGGARSEERRVGKECRSGWTAYE